MDLSEQWRHFIRLIQTRFWTLVTFFSVVLLVVLVGVSLQARVYRAMATVLIDMETPSLLAISTARDDSTVGQTNYLTYADYYRTQLEVIRSRSIAEKVYSSLKLSMLPQYARAKDPVAALLSQVKVEPIKQTRMARVYVEDPNPKQAARIANEFALIFVEENHAKAAAAETMTLRKNEYLKLTSKEAELSKRYKDKFPAMIRIRQQIDQLARSIEGDMKRQLYFERHQLDLIDQSDQEARRLMAEKFRGESLVAGFRPNNIRVQDLAQPSAKPFKPNVKLGLLLAVFLGLLGGFAAAVIEELLDGSIKDVADVERDGRFVFLGQIPRFDGAVAGGESSPASSEKHYQYVHTEPQSQAAEAYRVLRTSLIYAAPQEPNRALVITSPGSGEGKTTTVTNLGIALAHIGLRVILVDADLRKPNLHRAFGLSLAPGLSEFLIGNATFEEIVRPTDIAGLWVVPSGATPPNPAELLALPAMKEFVEWATNNFNRVLLDTPPVIPVTDAVILAALTRSVVAVAQSAKTPRQAVSRLTNVLQDVHAKVLGIVLNSVSTSYASSYYYGYPYAPYRYGSGEGNGKDAAPPPVNGVRAWIRQLAARAQHHYGQKGEKPVKAVLKRDAKSR